MAQLIKQQITRQDFVDNQIFVLINSLLPTSKQIKWDIELIGGVREAIRKNTVKNANAKDEMNFYPFIKI